MKSLREMSSHCYAIALALHAKYGWEVRAVMMADILNIDSGLRDAYRLIYEAAGTYPEYEFAKSELCKVRPLSIDDWVPVHGYCVDEKGMAIDYLGFRDEKEILDGYSNKKAVLIAFHRNAITRIEHLADIQDIERAKSLLSDFE